MTKKQTASPLAFGIDVSSKKLDVALLFDDDSYQIKTVDNTKNGFRELFKWIKKRGAKQCPACLEATGRYGDNVAEFLHDRKINVSVVNPAQVKLYAQSQLKRNKTDREDAKVIAHFCWTQKPRKWEPPTPELKELQALTRHLDTLKNERTRLKNRLQSGISSKIVLRDLKQQLTALNKRITTIEQHTDDHIDAHPDIKEQQELLLSIPGIGKVTAAAFIAEVPDVTMFSNVGQLVAYAGLSPRLNQSGSSLRRRGGIAKTGSRRLRTLFYMPAISAMRHNPIVSTFAQRLLDKGKARMVAVTASMRKLLHLVYGVLKHRRPFDPHHQQATSGQPATC